MTGLESIIVAGVVFGAFVGIAVSVADAWRMVREEEWEEKARGAFLPDGFGAPDGEEF